MRAISSGEATTPSISARLRETREAHDLILDVVVDADQAEIAPREAGEHRHGEDARPAQALAAADARHLLARAGHHREAARGVQVEEPHAEPRRLDAGLGDRASGCRGT